MNRIEKIIDGSLRAIILYFAVASIFVSLMAAIGVSYLMDEKPNVFNETILSFELFWWILTIHPIIVLVIIGIVMQDKITFRWIYRKKKKVE